MKRFYLNLNKHRVLGMIITIVSQFFHDSLMVLPHSSLTVPNFPMILTQFPPFQLWMMLLGNGPEVLKT